MATKRSGEGVSALIKRQRTEEENDPNVQQIVVASDGNTANKGALIQSIRRTSGLQAPIMCLQGHQGEVLDVKFDKDGDNIASSGIDKTILLWRVYGDCKNYGILRLPKGPATSICWVSATTILAGSTDHTVFLFDLTTGGSVIRRFRGHRGVVNSVDVQRGGAGKGLFASASDDGTVRIWSEDEKESIETIELGYPLTTVKWSADSQSLYIGGIDNDIHVFSLAHHSITYSLRGHGDTITSLSLSPSGTQLLSASMDSTLNLWNIQPFAPTVNAQNPTLHPRLLRSFYGAPAGFEGVLRKASWSRHGQSGNELIAVGGADRSLTVWDATTSEIKYKLPGHPGTVVATDWSPKEPIIVSADVGGVIYLGEVDA
ncbi:putative subunit of the heterotrimeric G protein [Meredithblackwellia eburnea MCA 4105]